MKSEHLDQWTNFTNTAFASAKELGEINAKAIKKLSEQQLEFVSSCLDTNIKQINLLTEAKGYKEMLSGQTKLINDYNEKLLESVRRTASLISETKDEVAAWLDKSIEGFTASVKKYALPKRVATDKAAA
jgi:phasin family protein